MKTRISDRHGGRARRFVRSSLLLSVALALALPAVALAQPPYPVQDNRAEVRTYSTASRMQQWQDAENYYLDVLLIGMPTGAVSVTPRGSVLMVEISGGQRQQQISPDGSVRSMISSSQHVRRPIRVPRDADVQHLQRQDLSDRVRLILPKRNLPESPMPGLKAEPDARL